MSASKPTANGVSSTTLFVRNLAFATTSQELEDLFSTVGPIKNAFIVTDKSSAPAPSNADESAPSSSEKPQGRSRGFGFVEFRVPEDAESAMNQYQAHELHGRAMKLELANKKPPRQPLEKKPQQSKQSPSTSSSSSPPSSASSSISVTATSSTSSSNSSSSQVKTEPIDSDDDDQDVVVQPIAVKKEKEAAVSAKAKLTKVVAPKKETNQVQIKREPIDSDDDNEHPPAESTSKSSKTSSKQPVKVEEISSSSSDDDMSEDEDDSSSDDEADEGAKQPAKTSVKSQPIPASDVKTATPDTVSSSDDAKDNNKNKPKSKEPIVISDPTAHTVLIEGTFLLLFYFLCVMQQLFKCITLHHCL
jgi:nucleolar protein 4